MKFKVGDQVLVTSGKDKGKKGAISKVLPPDNKVVIEEVNLYTRHVRKFGTQAGQKVVKPRPLATAKIAILNDKGEPDRIGYKFEADGKKVRIYKKTGTVIPVAKDQAKDQKAEAKKEAKKVDQAEKEVTKEAKAAAKAPAKKPAVKKTTKTK